MWSKLGAKVSSLFGKASRRSAAPSPVLQGEDIDSMVPDDSLAAYVGGGGADAFKSTGRMQVEWLQNYGGIEESDDVLEVGCGIGRIAVPLTQYLRFGTYSGFDVVAHGIEWCQQRITPRYPNFTFSVADIHNKLYNPEGKLSASEYSFPFSDASFDFVFLTSVFTHMLSKDMEHYAMEIGRVLRPGGRCYCTAYLITDDAKRAMTAGDSVRVFRPLADDPAWAESAELPEAAIAYPDGYLFEVFSRAGMSVVKVVAGEWNSNPYSQDVFVTRRAVLTALRTERPTTLS